MVYIYSISLEGSSHIQSKIGNQDSCHYSVLDDGIVIAAIADGVGSSKYADVASRIAVETSVEVCEKYLRAKPYDGNVLPLIKEAFTKAELEIDKHSLHKEHLLSDYDTTLSLVIYDGKKVSYGHCGDGGIIGLTIQGDYVKITDPQKEEGFFVVPLRKREKWVFGQHTDEFASLLLATDGVYDTLFPYLLKGQPVEINVLLARSFMDNSVLKINDETYDSVIEGRKQYLDSEKYASVTDDKTILVIVNEDIAPERKEDSYYAQPDWKLLQEEWNKKAYPHLYAGNEETTVEEATISDCG